MGTPDRPAGNSGLANKPVSVNIKKIPPKPNVSLMEMKDLN